jgi:hypothetical protein
MTDSNPIARFRKNRQEAGKKFREKLKKNEEIIKQTTSSKVIRGALSGPLKAVNETVEFVDDIYDYAVGNPYDNNELIDLQGLGLEIKGDKEDWAYTVPQAITQFLLPAGVISKGLKGTKLVGMGNAWARNAVAGFVTDAVVQDPYEENLFNMIDKHPRLATPISELLKAKTPEEISVAEARFRQASGGLLAGEALTALGLGVKAMKKTPELYERVINRLSRRDEILMTDNVVDNLGDEIIDDLNLPNKVVKDGEKVDTTFNTKTKTEGQYFETTTLTGGGDPDVQKLIIDRADKIKQLDANNAWPYKRTFADMVKNANDLLPAEVIESARLFNARYGRGGEEDLPATLIAMNQLMNKNAINLASLAKSMDESLAAGNKAGFQELKGQFVTEAKVLDGLITLNKPLKTVPAQTLAANRAGGGVGQVAATVEDLKGRTPTEKAIDQATDIRGTVKEPTDPLAEFSLEEILNAAEQGDKASLKKLRLITKKLQAAQGNPQALQKMASESKIMRGLKVQNEIFINSILSGPETHAVNILSTSLNTLARPLEQTLGSFAQGDMTGAIRGGKELYYLMSSITDSLKAAKLSFQIEDNIVNPSAMIQEADRFQIRMEGDGLLANIINTYGTIVRLPSRFLLAEDEFFKQLNFRSYVKASAWEDGMRKGLQGADLENHIQRQFDGTIEIVNKNSMANVKDRSVLDLYEKAQQYAAETTFTADLPEGSLGGAIQGVARHPAGRIVFPFVRTPINIFKAQVRRTPAVNMLLQEYRQALKSTDPSVAAKAKGEMILGGSMWSIAGLTALSINNPMSELAITGGGPSDYNMLNQKRATGWQPYSFRFLLRDENGNVRMGKDGKPRYKYVSFRRLDPWSSFLMMAADAAAITGSLSRQDRDDFGVAAAVALGRNITNKTYLQGITELADLLGKPYKLESWLARRAAATVNPVSAFGRSVKKSGLTTSYGQIPADQRILDKKVRAGDDGMVVLRKFHNELAATIPAYGGGLRPMRNFITGSVIEYPVGYGPDTMSILNPIKETNSVNNTVLTTLDEIGARITQPSDELNLGRLPSGQPIGSGIELTYDEHLDLIEETAFVKINGITMVKALHNRIQQKDFQALMKSVRGELIEQNNMDIEVKAQEANRDLAEDILRDIVNKYKRAGKKVWLSKNPERELEYKQLQSAIRQEANNDILEGFNQLN